MSRLEREGQNSQEQSYWFGTDARRNKKQTEQNNDLQFLSKS